MHKRTTCLATLVFAVVLGGLVHSSCSPANASGPAAWVSTGNLNIARSFHTATLLSNGKVLVVGGADDNGDVRDSAELYDPATGTWSITGRPNGRHAGHTATLLPDGRVLVVGGVNVLNDLDNAELYDPGTGTWRRTGTATTYRSYHTATLLRSGKVLVAGGANVGYAGFNATAALYDPGTDTWSSVAGPITPRAWHQATLLLDGKVLVTGGSNDAHHPHSLASVEIFDPAFGVWSNTASLDTPFNLRHATLLPNGTVLVAGGPDINSLVARLFDPASGKWISAGLPRAGRYTDTATLLRNGKVLVTGGLWADGSEPLLASTELYDWSTGNWAYASNLNTARFGHTATLLSNGKVLVAGGAGVPRGAGSVRALQSAELYESGRSTIAAGFTGSWFNPQQNGHGFALEVLSGDPPRLLASWFTFAPQGGQAWIVGLGPITDDRAVLQGFQSVGPGGRFPPNFAAANVHQQDWGTLTFTFSDCNHGRVDWASSVPGYGSGGMDLTRLTLPAGFACE